MANSDKEARKARKKEFQAKQQQENSVKAKNWAREWFDALLWAAVAAMIIRTFFFEAYRIPTPSMEQTLLTGDFLIVSKMHYGARTPMTIGLPFTSVHIPGVTLPWFRIPGFQHVKRNDIVVFNYPVDAVAISQKTNYIKRCVAVPGDTLEIRNKVLYINHAPAQNFDTLEQLYTVTSRERVRLSESRIKLAGGLYLGSEAPNTYVVNMTEAVRDELLSWAEVESVIPRVRAAAANEYARHNFTFRKGMTGNPDHIEPMVIPFEGMQLALSEDTWPIYREVVERFERNIVERRDGAFVVNGVVTDTYTVQKNYYFMMGDNRDNSEDSRHWGFVPADHVVGKPAVIYFSWDKERLLPRFNRLFSLI